MFFNPDDIRWFKPLELWTKHGLSGHIRQPIGTHGSMKCTFNGHIKNHDTVCLTLYKRVYPKYPTKEEIIKFDFCKNTVSYFVLVFILNVNLIYRLICIYFKNIKSVK